MKKSGKSRDRVSNQIRFEIGQIDRLFEVYADLLGKARNEQLNIVEITALASILHSFYNGLENIFLVVAKRLDRIVPEGERWHRTLLDCMARTTSRRKQVLKEKTANRLKNYMAFRHFYRHSYSFFVEWDKLKELVLSMGNIWERAKGEILIFLEIIERPDGK